MGLTVLLFALAGFVAWFYLVPGPDKLTQIDWASGGGAGVEQSVQGTGFGTHGQKLDVWRPVGRAGERLPVIVFFYGGGWHAGTREGYGFAGRALAAQGFVVVIPDYRKVPDVRFPAFVADGAEAMRWVRDHVGEQGGDVARIAVMGHSAGAYIAAMLNLDSRYLIATCADPHLIKAAVGLSGPYDFYPFTTDNSRNAFGAFAVPAETQPISYARADAAPMLLATSDKDTTVKPRNAVALRDRLEALGAKVQFRNYPGLGHEDMVMALSKPFRGKAAVLADSVAFLHAALDEGGRGQR